MKLFDTPAKVWLGWAGITCAALTLVHGGVQFRPARREIAHGQDPHGSNQP